MNRKNALVLLVAVFVGACSCPVFGQYESSQKSPIGIGFSMVRPSDSALRDITSTWFGAMLDWNIRHDELDRPTIVGSVGWFGKSELTSKGSFVPLRLAYIKHLEEGSGVGWYAGGGLSAYYVNYEGFRQSIFTNQREYVDESGMKMGFNLLFGREFGAGWYAQLGYDNVSSLSLPTGGSLKFGGLSLTVGSRLAF